MHADDVMVARALLHPVRGCVSDTLVYREADFRIRRRRAEAGDTVTVMPCDVAGGFEAIFPPSRPQARS